MSVDYDHLYEEVIQQQWREISQAQRDAASSPDRRGQLNPDEPDGHALHDAFTYQRGHAEVFRAVELIYTTVSLSGGRLPELGQKLDQAGVSRKAKRITVRVKRRYPSRISDSNRVQWDDQSANWQVQSEHWVMRK